MCVYIYVYRYAYIQFALQCGRSCAAKQSNTVSRKDRVREREKKKRERKRETGENTRARAWTEAGSPKWRLPPKQPSTRAPSDPRRNN